MLGGSLLWHDFLIHLVILDAKRVTLIVENEIAC